MPRPPLSDERKSERPLKIRLTDAERERLDRAAASLGAKTSAWARELLLAAADQAKKPKRKKKRAHPTRT